jgi:hypothetical protein
MEDRILEETFYEVEPNLENYWRSIILFGRNVASYKFALAKSLYEFQGRKDPFIKLEELAVPFTKHILEHLKKSDKQGTSTSSKFLDVCREFHLEKVSHTSLIDATVKLGFNNVIDAFHIVKSAEVPKRFFIDERKNRKGITLTDEFFKLSEVPQFENIISETESRWRLVETAWELNLSKNLIQIEYEAEGSLLVTGPSIRRVGITGVIPSLNGYQKGKCFYCFRELEEIEGGRKNIEVDHFFPHTLRQCDPYKPINGVSNLVLSCVTCNRGEKGKFDRLPSLSLLKRLFRRNEYLIRSHHPLRETLLSQIGTTYETRVSYLQEAYNCASSYFGFTNKWEPVALGSSVF